MLRKHNYEYSVIPYHPTLPWLGIFNTGIFVPEMDFSASELKNFKYCDFWSMQQVFQITNKFNV